MEILRLVSINVGKPHTLRLGSRDFRTGIDKRPTDDSVHIGQLGLEGDAILDTEHHGGPDQAVYVYGAEDYRWWSQELGRDIRPGTFGDNLTIAGFPDDLNAGDRLLIGDVILEATAPRIPCSTFAAQMQDSNFGLRFRRAERPGVYFRVLNEGAVTAGEPVTFIENPDPSVSMREMFRLWFEPQPAPDAVARLLEAPVAERARERFRKKLEEAPAEP